MSTTQRSRSIGRSVSVPLYLLVVLGLLLVAAGGASAGKMITGKQIKNNSVTTADIKNKTLKLKDFHPSQLAALRGSAFGTPPSGMTMVGGGIIAQDAPTSTRYPRGPAPLPFRTAVPMTVDSGRNLYFGSTPIAAVGQSNPSLCSGSDTNPTAAPGIMCVYISGSVMNAGTLAYVFPGVSTGPDGADSTMFYVGVNAPEEGEVLVRFVWAYTAP